MACVQGGSHMRALEIVWLICLYLVAGYLLARGFK